MDEQGDRRTPARTAAGIESSRWPGWIWAVPIAALAIVVWLVLQALTYGGVNITVRFARAAGMRAGNTWVHYLGIRVGQVTDVTLSKDGRHVIVKVNIHDDAKKYLRANTRFWLEGATPSLSAPASLKALVAGPTIIMEPGGGKPARHFIGLDYRPAIIGPQEPLLPYVMYFDGAVGEIDKGAPVKLRGFTVGEVSGRSLTYDAVTGTIQTPVIVGLDPSRFHVAAIPPANVQSRPILNDVLQRLIQRGMRGRMVQSPPLIGGYAISLDFVPGAAAASLQTGGSLPVIPTVSGGGFGSIVQRVNRMPIDQIADNILEITRHADSIVSSPALRGSIEHLDRTLAELQSTIHDTGPQITKLVQSLHQTADQLDTAVAAANTTLGGNPMSQDHDARTALYEVTLAARSVRSLANYLDRHPEALVKGRSGQ
jgi:paraquat-inducible protein B